MDFTTRCCETMRSVGIDDPESQVGKDFCVNGCPYPSGCILLKRGPHKGIDKKYRQVCYPVAETKGDLSPRGTARSEAKLSEYKEVNE